MTAHRDIRAHLEPNASDDLVRLAERLERGRPVPSAAFRGNLRRSLLAGEALLQRPARLRLLIAGYASAGAALLAVAAVSISGIGP